MAMTRDNMTTSLCEIESSDELEGLLRTLRANPLLRAVQMVSSQQDSDAGHQTGYDAQLLFQSERLNAQPIEVRLGAVIELAIEGAAIADASEIRGHVDDVGITLALRGARIVAAKIAYRPFPGSDPTSGDAMH